MNLNIRFLVPALLAVCSVPALAQTFTAPKEALGEQLSVKSGTVATVTPRAGKTAVLEQIVATCTASLVDEAPIPVLQVFSYTPYGTVSNVAAYIQMEKKVAAGGTRAIWYGTLRGPFYSTSGGAMTVAFQGSVTTLAGSAANCVLTLSGYWAVTPVN